jgi:hypothetical protein
LEQPWNSSKFKPEQISKKIRFWNVLIFKIFPFSIFFLRVKFCLVSNFALI